MQLELDQLKCCVDHLRVFETEFCLCRGRLPAEPEHPRKREDDVEEEKGNFFSRERTADMPNDRKEVSTKAK